MKYIVLEVFRILVINSLGLTCFCLKYLKMGKYLCRW